MKPPVYTANQANYYLVDLYENNCYQYMKIQISNANQGNY